MVYPSNAGYNMNAQWQQGHQPPPPPPQGGPPPPPPPQAPLSAEAAAKLQNYGYGAVGPGSRGGRPNARGARNAGFGRGQPEPYPPAKRTKYDSNPPPAAGQMQAPYAGTSSYPGQFYQPGQYQASLQPGQPVYQPMAMGAPQHVGQAYYPRPHQGQQGLQPNLPHHPYQYQVHMHQPMTQPHQLPPQPPHQPQEAHGPGPSLAVALMKATPMASGSRGGEQHRPNTQPQYNANLPPPPPSWSAPPPPPAFAEPMIPSGPKGLASLPERPIASSLPSKLSTSSSINPLSTPSSINPLSASSSASVPPTSSIPTGPAVYNTSIKRDTRPLPSQSKHVETNLRGSEGSSRGSHSGGNRGKPPPTGPSRGGGGRGGRGGGRSGFDGQRGPNRQNNQHQQNRRGEDRFDHSQQNREKGYKRTFSQTTGPPANSPRGPATRPRSNSNATATSVTTPLGPKKGQAANAKKRERTMEGSPAPSSANGKSLKRTLTDFRIDSLEIPSLNWAWKATPLSQILAKMNLKEQEESGAKKEEELDDNEQSIKQSEPLPDTPLEVDVQPALTEPGQAHVAEKQVEQVDTQEAAPVASTDLQRSDSRPEKRKHARDEDEEEEDERIRQAASEEAKDPVTHPVGKKVKSEKPSEGEDEIVSEAAETNLPLQVDGTSLTTDETSIATNPALAIDSSVAVPEEAVPQPGNAQDEMPDDVSESSDSSVEVADSMIASRHQEDKHSELPEVTPDPDDDASLADTSVKIEEEEEKAAVEKKPEARGAKGRGAIKSVPKKFWENSRLRIYFMSPVELEQKDVRQNLLKQKGKGVAAPTVPADVEQDLKQDDREASTDTVTEKTAVTAEPTSATVATVLEGNTKESGGESKPDGVDDLDGEPLAAEEEPETTVAEKVEKSEQAAETEKAEIENVAAAAEESLAKDQEESDGKEPEGHRIQLLPPSADRLSIAYAQNTRRLVVDAEVVDEVVLHRAEGKIEINLRVELPASEEEGLGFRCAKGVYVEKSLPSSEHSYEEIGVDDLVKAWDTDDASRAAGSADEDNLSSDHLSPPLHHLLAKKAEGSDAQAEEHGVRHCTIIAKMDRAHPLTEAKWVRTGNPDDWIQSVIGGNGNINTNNGGARAAQQLPKGEQGKNSPSNNTKNNSRDSKGSAWKGKIRVVDPDAHALENWLSSANTKNGFDEARYKFVNTHFQDVNNVLEVLLRLIRGSGSNSSSSERGNGGAGGSNSNTNNSGNSNTSNSGTSQSASLAAQAKASNAPYPDYQTPISLASYQIFKMALESASSSSGTPTTASSNQDGDNKKKNKNVNMNNEIERRIGEVIRNLPYSLIFKSLDSMFLDYKRGNLG